VVHHVAARRAGEEGDGPQRPVRPLHEQRLAERLPLDENSVSEICFTLE
jgi:hypothetical protein